MSDERKWEPDNRQAEGSPGANENRENIQNEQDTRNAQILRTGRIHNLVKAGKRKDL